MPVENFLLNVPDPTQQVLEGLKVGGAIRQQRVQRQFEAKRNAYLGSLSSESSLDDIMGGVQYMDESQREHALAVYGAMNEEQQQNTLQFAGQVLSAIKADPEVAIDMLNTRATAEMNSNEPEKAQAWKNLAEIIKINPEAAYVNAAIQIAALPGGADLIESLGILGGEKRAEEELPGKIAKVEAETKALTWETLQSQDLADIVKQQEKAKVENIESDTKLNIAKALEAAGSGGMDQEAKTQLELKLGDTFQKRVESVRANIDQVAKIEQAAADNTGAGDLALIFAFMKMLDPGSVVRESEYARAAEAQGLYRKLAELGHKIQDGRFLAPNARKMFAKLAKKLINHSMAYGASQFQLTSEQVKNYNLNMNNVLSKGDQRVFGQIAIEYVKGEELKDMAELDKLSAILDQQEVDPNINFIDPNVYFGDKKEAPSYMRFGE